MMRNRSRRATLVAAVVVAASGGGQSIAGAQDAYTLDRDWPSYPSDMRFEMGTGIAVDADGIIYTISRDIDHWAAHPLALSRYKGKGTIARWDVSGRFLGTFGDEHEFIGPHSMYIDSQGFVWVVDREGHQVAKLTPDGDAVLKLGEYGVFGDDESHFNGPTGVAFLPDGGIVVVAGYWHSGGWSGSRRWSMPNYLTTRSVRIPNANVYVHQMVDGAQRADIYAGVGLPGARTAQPRGI